MCHDREGVGESTKIGYKQLKKSSTKILFTVFFLQKCALYRYKEGMGNSICLAGHISNTFGLRGPVSILLDLKLSFKLQEMHSFLALQCVSE